MKRIDYDHPGFREIKDKALRYFNQEFNAIPLSLVEKAEKYLYDYVVHPRWVRKDCDSYEYGNNECKSDEHCEQCDEYHEMCAENYPMWGTIFEASNSFMGDWIDNHVDELGQIGVGVLSGMEDLRACLFIAGAGYDFYHAHWIPLFQLMGWVKEEEDE